MGYSDHRYKYISSTKQNEYTVLLLHGTGGDENDMLPLIDELGKHFNYFSLRGNVLENGMPRFFARLAMGVFDENDLRFRTEEISAFIIKVAAIEKFNPERLIALGYSNGANIAGAMLMQKPGLLKGAVLLRPMQPFKEAIPAFSVSEKIPILMTSGTLDPTVSAGEVNQYAELLSKSGYSVQLQRLSAGHNLIETDLKLAQEFLKKNFPQ